MIFFISGVDEINQLTSTLRLGMPPPACKGSVAKRVQITTLLSSGSPEATPNRNGLLVKFILTASSKVAKFAKLEELQAAIQAALASKNARRFNWINPSLFICFANSASLLVGEISPEILMFSLSSPCQCHQHY